MKTLLLFSLAVLATSLAACVHTPPGTSVNVALAKSAELVRAVEPPMPPPGTVPMIEPELPQNGTHGACGGGVFARGSFACRRGRTTEAIAAFEEAVRIDSGFHGGVAASGDALRKDRQRKEGDRGLSPRQESRAAVGATRVQLAHARESAAGSGRAPSPPSARSMSSRRWMRSTTSRRAYGPPAAAQKCVRQPNGRPS